MRYHFLAILILLSLVACPVTLPGALTASGGPATQSAMLARYTTPQVTALQEMAPQGGPAEPGAAPVSEGAAYTPAAYSPAYVPAGTQTPSLPASTPTLAPSPTLTPFELCSPLEGIQRSDLPRLVSDGYTAPPPGSDARHEGIDLVYYNFKGHRMIEGSGVQALMDGWVAAALKDTFPYGNFIIIETPNERLPEDLKTALKVPSGASLYYLYAHLQADSLQVSLGEAVTACQVMGKVGRTGNTAAPHLHLETRLGPPGARFSAMSYFTELATGEEKRNYRLWRISGTYQHFDPMHLLGYQIPTWPTPVPIVPKVQK